MNRTGHLSWLATTKTSLFTPMERSVATGILLSFEGKMKTKSLEKAYSTLINLTRGFFSMDFLNVVQFSSASTENLQCASPQQLSKSFSPGGVK